MDHIYRIYLEAMKAVEQYHTRDPYELLDCIGASVHLVHDFAIDGLKGFAAIRKGKKFAVINARLDEHEQRIVAGHEAAHLILHEEDILRSPMQALKDFNLLVDPGCLENEANRFLADFIISDEDVLDAALGKEHDFYAGARALCLLPELFAFKLYSMAQRGFPVRNPVDLKSDFLRQRV